MICNSVVNLTKDIKTMLKTKNICFPVNSRETPHMTQQLPPTFLTLLQRHSEKNISEAAG